MTTASPSAISQARAAWLAGDADAWARYTASLRTLDTRLAKRDRPRQARRTRRIRRLRLIRRA